LKYGVPECRFEVWPYLDRFAEDATKAAKHKEEEEEQQSRTVHIGNMVCLNADLRCGHI